MEKVFPAFQGEEIEDETSGKFYFLLRSATHPNIRRRNWNWNPFSTCSKNFSTRLMTFILVGSVMWRAMEVKSFGVNNFHRERTTNDNPRNERRIQTNPQEVARTLICDSFSYLTSTPGSVSSFPFHSDESIVFPANDSIDPEHSLEKHYLSHNSLQCNHQSMFMFVLLQSSPFYVRLLKNLSHRLEACFHWRLL